MFDGEALGLEVVAATKAHVDKAVAPLLARIAELEERLSESEQLFDSLGTPETTAKAWIAEAIAAIPPQEPEEFDLEAVRVIAQEIVEARLVALPVPENGKDGERGEPGEPGKDGSDGKDGKDVTLADLEPVIRYQLEETMAAIPIPKDGAPGRDGIDGKDAVLPDLSILEYAPDEVANSIALAVKKMAEFSGTRIVEVAEKSIPVTLPTFNFTLADNREPPVVNIEAAPAPVVNMAGPTISVAAPQVHVDIPKRGREVTTVTGWDKAGRVTSFEKVEADE